MGEWGSEVPLIFSHHFHAFNVHFFALMSLHIIDTVCAVSVWL